MVDQLTCNAEALRLFFTEDVFIVKNEPHGTLPTTIIPPKPLMDAVAPVEVPAVPQAQMAASPSRSTHQVPQAQHKTWEFSYLGKNQKRILILVNDGINAVSSPEGTELLRKLVKAINLANNDFALVNYAKYNGARFKDLHQFFNCELLISFGVGYAQLELPEQALHQLGYANDTRLIFTTNLHGLHQDNQSKKMLWATLQQLQS